MYLNKNVRDIIHFEKDFKRFIYAVHKEIKNNQISKYLEKFNTALGFMLYVCFLPYFLLAKIFHVKDTSVNLSTKEKWIIGAYYLVILGALIHFKFTKEVLLAMILLVPLIIVFMCVTISWFERMNYFFNTRYVKKHLNSVKSKVVKDFIRENKINTYSGREEKGENDLQELIYEYFQCFMKRNLEAKNHLENFKLIKKSNFDGNSFLLLPMSKWFVEVNKQEILLLIYNENKDDLDDIYNKIESIWSNLIYEFKFLDNSKLNAFSVHHLVVNFDEQVKLLLNGKEREIRLEEMIGKNHKKEIKRKKEKI